MRFLVTVNMRTDVGPPPPALVEAMGRGIADTVASGAMLDTGGLLPTTTQVRVSGGELLVTDGPFAEAREVAGGFSIITVDSYEEAVRLAQEVAEIHRRHWPAWEGMVEVRQIADQGSTA